MMKTKILLTACLLGASLGGFAQWVSEASVPMAESQATAVAHPNGNIYLIGGDIGASEVDSVFVFNQAGNTWTSGTAYPVPTRGAAVALGHDSLIYVFGGYAGSGYVDSVYAYNTKTKTWTRRAPLPTPVWYAAAATAPSGKIVVFGGENSNPTTLVQIYNPMTDTWTSGTSIPVPVLGEAAVTSYNGKIYVIGGENGSNVIDSVQIYDPVADSWSRGTPMPTARHEFGFAIDENGSIWCSGGKTQYGNNGKPFFDTVEVYNPNTDSWSRGPLLPHGLGETTSACINNGINVMSGVDSISGYSALNYRIGVMSDGVQNIKTAPNITIYPNPSAGSVNVWIAANDEQSTTVRICDVTGHICYEQTWTNIGNGYNKTLDLSGYSKGVYFIQFSSAKANVVKKLILQ